MRFVTSCIDATHLLANLNLCYWRALVAACAHCSHASKLYKINDSVWRPQCCRRLPFVIAMPTRRTQKYMSIIPNFASTTTKQRGIIHCHQLSLPRVTTPSSSLTGSARSTDLINCFSLALDECPKHDELCDALRSAHSSRIIYFSVVFIFLLSRLWRIFVRNQTNEPVSHRKMAF